MSKDKDKKKKGKKKDKANGSIEGLQKATKSLKSVAENPLVADVVAAALVATASALKDSNKARQLASHAGEQLGEMAKKSGDRGNAMWQLALEIGRQTLQTLAEEKGGKAAKGK